MVLFGAPDIDGVASGTFGVVAAVAVAVAVAELLLLLYWTYSRRCYLVCCSLASTALADSVDNQHLLLKRLLLLLFIISTVAIAATAAAIVSFDSAGSRR